MRYPKSLTTFYIILIFSVFSCKQNSETKLNLGFEDIDTKTQKAKNWHYQLNNQSKIVIDTEISYKGKNSLRIESSSDSRKLAFVSSIYFPIQDLGIKQNVKLSGFIKTKNVTSDSLGLMVIYENSEKSDFKLLKSSDLIGTNDWKEYSVSLPINIETDKIIVGVCLLGKGTIWIDNLKLFVDGKQISKLPAPNNFVASNKEIRWLKNNSITIKTELAENGFDDLQPLKKLIGNARIVALGENTHGTSEVFKMKHRLVEFLTTQMGFTIFSIEANMPEAYKLNDYVLRGEGDPKKLLKGMYFWTWDTQEVLDMIVWMKNFNSNGKGKVQFTGFDMQFQNGSLENLSKFSKENNNVFKTELETITKLFSKSPHQSTSVQNAKDLEIIEQNCESILAYFTKNKENIHKSLTESEYNSLVQNVNILIQVVQYKGKEGFETVKYRDASMAKNIDWILANNLGKKIILWAHNGHIETKKGSMGSHLSDTYGNDYYNIGFLSNNGTYTAVNSKTLSSDNVLLSGEPGSFEYSFHKTDIPLFYFDFRSIDKKIPESLWLSKRLNYRSIGSVAMENQFNPSTLTDLFDAIIYIDKTNASECFRVSKKNQLDNSYLNDFKKNSIKI